MKKLSSFISAGIKDITLLLRSIPSLTITLFILSIVCANLMANKELVSLKYVALDCGFVFSWIMFLCMDVICKHWGAKAAVKVSVVALIVNILVTFTFALLSLSSGKWGAFYSYDNPTLQQTANEALNSTFCGAWYVVVGSGTAFLLSSLVNAALNHLVGKKTTAKGFAEFALRSYASTMIAQFVDNLTFATLVSKLFFGWTWTQVLICSFIGAICELLCEVIFSGLGYKIIKSWQKNNVGAEYFAWKAEQQKISEAKK